MILNEDQLKQIYEHAYDLLTWKDIAYLMKLDTGEFKTAISENCNKISIAYHKGKTERKKKLHQPVLKLAEMGAPQAELLAQKYLEEQNYAETDD